jgi:hypothetical protein
VRARLTDRPRANKENEQLVLTRYAIERLLYRLGRSAHRNRFILIGAMLFGLWANVPYRATGDLDLLAFGATDATAVLALFRSICTSGTEDDSVQFIADTLRAEQARAEDEYQGLRLTVVAMIAGQVDIGFGDVITPAAIFPPRNPSFLVTLIVSRDAVPLGVARSFESAEGECYDGEGIADLTVADHLGHRRHLDDAQLTNVVHSRFEFCAS